ncbi:hypothetical protein NDK43_06690 [Neobacillus pocheonensis]|uniref:YrzO family protein n=1 Tax=Neobacillus pocheonensis TaxID=363869 RepID=A0ABT0WAW0_9BACI|nr:hypothetical protein [Neobacillus pocheonensis]
MGLIITIALGIMLAFWLMSKGNKPYTRKEAEKLSKTYKKLDDMLRKGEY